MFPIACPNCQARFKGKPEYLGRNIKCPKCEQRFTVEAPPADDTPNDLYATPPMQSRSSLGASSSQQSTASAAPPVVTTSADQSSSRLPVILTIVGIVVLIGVGAIVAIMFIGGEDPPVGAPNDDGREKNSRAASDPPGNNNQSDPSASQPKPLSNEEQLRQLGLRIVAKLERPVPEHLVEDAQPAVLFKRLGAADQYERIIGNIRKKVPHANPARDGTRVRRWYQLALAEHRAGDNHYRQTLEGAWQQYTKDVDRLSDLSQIITQLCEMQEKDHARKVLELWMDKRVESKDIEPGNTRGSYFGELFILVNGLEKALETLPSVRDEKSGEVILRNAVKRALGGRNHSQVVQIVKACQSHNHLANLFDSALYKLIEAGDLDAVADLVEGCPNQIEQITSNRWWSIAKLCLDTGEDEQARTIVLRALRRDYDLVRALAATAPVIVAAEGPERLESLAEPVIQGLSQAPNMRPHTDRLNLLIALAYHRAGNIKRYDQIVEAVTGQLKADPRERFGLKLQTEFWLAYVQMKAGNPDGARSRLHEFLAKMPANNGMFSTQHGVDTALYEMMLELSDNEQLTDAINVIKEAGYSIRTHYPRLVDALMDAGRHDHAATLIELTYAGHQADVGERFVREMVAAGHASKLVRLDEITLATTTQAISTRVKHAHIATAIADLLAGKFKDGAPSERSYAALLPPVKPVTVAKTPTQSPTDRSTPHPSSPKPHHDPSLAQAIELIKQDDKNAQIAAALAIHKHSRSALPAVHHLVKRVGSDADPTARLYALYALTYTLHNHTVRTAGDDVAAYFQPLVDAILDPSVDPRLRGMLLNWLAEKGNGFMKPEDRKRLFDLLAPALLDDALRPVAIRVLAGQSNDATLLWGRRSSSARSSGDLARSTAIDAAMRQLLASDDPDRQSAGLTLAWRRAGLYDDQSFDALRPYMSDPDPNRRLWCLGIASTHLEKRSKDQPMAPDVRDTWADVIKNAQSDTDLTVRLTADLTLNKLLGVNEPTRARVIRGRGLDLTRYDADELNRALKAPNQSVSTYVRICGLAGYRNDLKPDFNALMRHEDVAVRRAAAAWWKAQASKSVALRRQINRAYRDAKDAKVRQALHIDATPSEQGRQPTGQPELFRASQSDLIKIIADRRSPHNILTAAMQNLRSPDRAGIAAVARHLSHNNSNVRAIALTILSRSKTELIASHLSAVQKRLAPDESDTIRSAALRTILTADPDLRRSRRAVEQMADAPPASIQFDATLALIRATPGEVKHVQRALDLIAANQTGGASTHDIEKHCKSVGHALSKWTPEQCKIEPSLPPALVAQLRDPDPLKREAAMKAVLNLGPAGRAAGHLLFDLPFEQGHFVSTKDFDAWASEPAIPQLVRIIELNVPYPERSAALSVLRLIGPPASAALPALRNWANGSRPPTMVQQTIDAIEGKAATNGNP